MEKIIKGYVIKLSQYKESDAIVTLLDSSSGKLLSFLARGVLKSISKNSPSCQLYTYGEYCLDYKLETSKNHTLKTGIILDYIPNLYSKIEINVVLGLLSEGILKLEESMEDEERLQLFSTVFDALKTKDNYLTDVLVILKYFMFYCGIIMEADCCVVCGSKSNIVDVSFSDGGYICYKCNHNYDPKRSDTYLKNYRYIMKADITNVNDFVVDEAAGLNLIKEFFSYLEDQAGLTLKSKSVVLDIIK